MMTAIQGRKLWLERLLLLACVSVWIERLLIRMAVLNHNLISQKEKKTPAVFTLLKKNM